MRREFSWGAFRLSGGNGIYPKPADFDRGIRQNNQAKERGVKIITA
jgi:hypothetical protein